MKRMTKISALILILLLVQTQAQVEPKDSTEGENSHFDAHTDHAPLAEPHTHTPSHNESGSYWEKEFQQNAQKFYQHFEVFFVDFVVPAYHMVKESALLTSVTLLILILYLTRVVVGLFKGDGTKKFKYNKEEPISYADLNQHFRNFTKELDDLKQQVKKAPEGQAIESQAAASTNSVHVPELEKLTKSLGKTEEHLTKLYQENKQLNQFLASFQKEILESHKELWKELHTLKTARPAGVKSGERRGQSVSAEDRIPKRLQETTPKPLEASYKPKENTGTAKPTDLGQPKTVVSNGTGSDARSHPASNDTSVIKSQELSARSSHQQEHHTATETKLTESSNPFANPIDQKPPGPGIQTNPVARQPGFRGPISQGRVPIGGVGVGGGIKQPPFGTPSDIQKSTVVQPEQKQEVQKPTPTSTDTNPFGGFEKPTTTTELSTKPDTEPSNTEEEKSTTTEQTNPEVDTNQISGFGAGPFKGIPPKKPTPVVRNNFAIPQKRVNPVPNNAIKKNPPLVNPSTNFVPNPDGSGGSNI